jgi:hypothetical protein
LVEARWAPSMRTVTAQDVVYHAADNRNTIARASIVAIAVTVALATVIDRTIVDRATAIAAIAAIAAPVSGNTAATSGASRMSAASDANRVAPTSAHSTGAHMSDAGMTAWMAGS